MNNKIYKSTEFTNVVKGENNNHNFLVIRNNENEDVIAHIKFQKGQIKENEDMNGILLMDMLNIVKLQVEGFQKTPFACKENQEALDHIKAALEILNNRANRRKNEGKYNRIDKESHEND